MFMMLSNASVFTEGTKTSPLAAPAFTPPSEASVFTEGTETLPMALAALVFTPSVSMAATVPLAMPLALRPPRFRRPGSSTSRHMSCRLIRAPLFLHGAELRLALGGARLARDKPT